MKASSYPLRVSIILLIAVITVFAVPVLASAADPNIFVAAGGTGNGTLMDPYGSIQAALDAAVAGDVISVGEGTYTGSYTLNKSVSLYGAGADKTILQGDGTDCVLYIASTGIKVSGFTITDGVGRTISVTNTGNGQTVDKRAGGAILIDGGVAQIENNIIRDNTVGQYGYGGAIYACDGPYNESVINNNIITGNSAGYGGAICADWQSAITIKNNTIVDNSASFSGGGIACYSSLRGPATNNVVARNSAVADGGGVYIYDYMDCTMVNSTIVSNDAGWSGGGVYAANVGGYLFNSIVWGNVKSGTTTASNLYCPPWNGSIDAKYSCIEGTSVYTGTGNIATNPLFVDAASGDYNLKVNSPAVNKGAAKHPIWNIYAPTTDRLGTIRPQGAGYDMGAFERTATELTVPLLNQAVTVSFPAVWASSTGATAQPAQLAAGQTPPTGSLLLGDAYYDISTSANNADRVGSATVTLSFDDTGLSDTEKASIKLYHYTSGGAWENITNQDGLNLSSKTVSGTTTSFSGFGVFYTEDAPVPPQEPENPETPLTTTPASSGWSIALTAAMGLIFYRVSRKQS